MEGVIGYAAGAGGWAGEVGDESVDGVGMVEVGGGREGGEEFSGSRENQGDERELVS